MASFPSLATIRRPPLADLGLARDHEVDERRGVLLDADPHRQVAQLGRDPQLGRQLVRRRVGRGRGLRW
jgi:hypothetical protein